jgi:hypothetical protein
MENKNKPAFPPGNPMVIGNEGLTKREMFAMAAMQGMLANPKWEFSQAYAAVAALAEADELIKQLES